MENLTLGGVNQLLHQVERQRKTLRHMRDEVEKTIADNFSPSVGQRRDLYMNQLVDALANVRTIQLLLSL